MSLSAAWRSNSACQSNEIRSRLLNKLGIYEQSTKIGSGSESPSIGEKSRFDGRYSHTASKMPQNYHKIHPPRRGAVPFHIPLKSGSSKHPTVDHVTSKTKPKIAFSNTVSVLPIPMRNEYSSRIQKRLWNDRLETSQNIARNTMEFAAEGWNWRTVTEDDGMYVCSVSGALIHPVHCLRQRYYSSQAQSRRGNNEEKNQSSAGK